MRGEAPWGVGAPACGRQVILRAEAEAGAHVWGKDFDGRVDERALQPFRYAGRGAAGLHDIEKFRIDRMRLEPRKELAHHGVEVGERTDLGLDTVEARDSFAFGKESQLVGIAQRADETVIGDEEAIAGCSL